jgi:hypothetical protein
MADQHFVLWNATLAVASLQEEVLAFDARQQKCPLERDAEIGRRR